MTALVFARSASMEMPAINLVEKIDLTPADALLPILECVSNSIISLNQTDLAVQDREIDIEIVRGEPREPSLLPDVIKPIKDVVISDNGIGFNDANLISFKTPHSNVLKKYGCLGVGRFAILAAFQQMKIRSTYKTNGHWKCREFDFHPIREVKLKVDSDSSATESKTTVELCGLYNKDIYDNTAVSVDHIAKAIMEHFLVFYLSDTLPKITVREINGSASQSVNDLYQGVSKDREKVFDVAGYLFKAYITRNPKTSNRKHHYVHYCADSRVVGRGKQLRKLDSIFEYPLVANYMESFLDVFVVSKYLDEKKTSKRNGFRIPTTDEERTYDGEITFQGIGSALVEKLREEYDDHVKQSQERGLSEWREFIAERPRFNSLLRDEETLRALPSHRREDEKEEELYRIVYRRQKRVEEKIQEFITTKQANEETIQEVAKEIKEKAVLDHDRLADYMAKRKAVIEVLDKFLEADKNGDYRLERDIHNLIFPMGGTNADTDYEAHNLWLLDERFVSYQFIGSDRPICTYSTTNSQRECDIALYDTFDNPVGYGDAGYGDISSLVIFEFKRPGEVAGTQRKDYHWDFSELIDKYFTAFRYGKRKNKGKAVNVSQTTRKFGYIILSDIPEELANYNRERGWEKTPFDTFYKLTHGSNQHLEAMKFDTLIRAARQRHNPFFERLFVGHQHPTPPSASPASSTRGL